MEEQKIPFQTLGSKLLGLFIIVLLAFLVVGVFYLPINFFKDAIDANNAGIVNTISLNEFQKMYLDQGDTDKILTDNIYDFSLNSLSLEKNKHRFGALKRVDDQVLEFEKIREFLFYENIEENRDLKEKLDPLIEDYKENYRPILQARTKRRIRVYLILSAGLSLVFILVVRKLYLEYLESLEDLDQA